MHIEGSIYQINKLYINYRYYLKTTYNIRYKINI